MAREIVILAVGRLNASPEKEMIERYARRLKFRLETKEIAQHEMREKECEQILKFLNPTDCVVVLDHGGKECSSEKFADLLSDWQSQAQRIVFVIGGAEGLTKAVVDKSRFVLSFGRATWPHMLVRVLLVEQIFRAQCIWDNHPYHKAGRPD